MKLNVLNLVFDKPIVQYGPRTHEGAPAAVLTTAQTLRRSVLSCMLWEGEFYESGVSVASRIRELVPLVDAREVAALAVEARTRMKLRHAPLLLVREMARYASHRALVAETLAAVIQRADELAEFVAIYWSEGKVPLSAQVKKGLAAAFTRFDEYALAKYDRAGAIRLRDVLFLCHAKPVDAAQAALWKRLIDGELATPDTWEVALSAAGTSNGEVSKLAVWERLLAERKLGALALLRNLRNMLAAGVAEKQIATALDTMRTDRVLPFRFLAAARYAPQMEDALERAMFRAVEGMEKLRGRTVLLVDVSGSMVARISHKSEMLRTDAAYGLAVLLRELCEEVSVFTFSEKTVRIAPRRGFALRDALEASQPHMGTYLGRALAEVGTDYDRIVVLTDEQSHDHVSAPHGKGYMINVASARNGVGYGEWIHFDGFSEAVVDYIREAESMPLSDYPA